MILKCYYNDMKTRTYIFVFRDVLKDVDYRTSVEVPNVRDSYEIIEKILLDKDLRLVNTYYVLSGPTLCLAKIRKYHFKGFAFEFFRPLDTTPYASFDMLYNKTKVVPDESRT